MIIETLLIAGAKAFLGKAAAGAAVKTAGGLVAKGMLAHDVYNAVDSVTSASSLADGVDVWGNPPSDVHGNPPSDTWGNPAGGDVHGNPPSDGWGRPTY